MPTRRNVSPLGDIDVPLLRRTLAAGEVFECTDEQAEQFDLQPNNFAQVKATAKKKDA